MLTTYAVPASLLAGAGSVFIALALSHRWDLRRCTAAGDRADSAVLAAAYYCLAALSFLWMVANAPLPALVALSTLGVDVALLMALSMKLWVADRDRRRVTVAVAPASLPVGEQAGSSSTHASTLDSGASTRRLPLLHRKQCIGTRRGHPPGAD